MPGVQVQEQGTGQGQPESGEPRVPRGVAIDGLAVDRLARQGDDHAAATVGSRPGRYWVRPKHSLLRALRTHQVGG